MYSYQSLGDAQQRLKNTVVMFKCQPVFIQEVLSLREMMVRDIMTGKDEVVGWSPSDFTRPVLGYINLEGRAYYVSRKPCRRVRQGLCQENIGTHRGGLTSQLLRSKPFARMLIGDYPSFKSAVTNTIVEQSVREVAFSRDFAVDHEGDLMYSGSPCGKVDKQGTVTFNKGFECLKEMFDAEVSKTSAA